KYDRQPVIADDLMLMTNHPHDDHEGDVRGVPGHLERIDAGTNDRRRAAAIRLGVAARDDPIDPHEVYEAVRTALSSSIRSLSERAAISVVHSDTTGIPA